MQTDDNPFKSIDPAVVAKFGAAMLDAQLEKPLEPAPPIGANMHIDMAAPGGDRSVLTDGKGNSVDVTGATPEDIDKIIARAKPPEIEIVAINGLPVGISPIMKHEVVQGGTTPGKSTTKTVFPPGFDVTRQLVLNSDRCKGKLGRKAARMQLKEAKKAQLKHLKEIGYFKNPPIDKPYDEPPTIKVSATDNTSR